MRKALENDANKVKQVKDKLFINNRLYKPYKNDRNSKFVDKQVDQSQNQKRKYTSSQKSSRKNVNQNAQNLTQSWANRLNAIPEFSMPNRYEALSKSVDSGETPQRNTKRTASSPLETNVQNKEPRQSPDSDEERESQTGNKWTLLALRNPGRDISFPIFTRKEIETIRIRKEIKTIISRLNHFLSFLSNI